eukprot:GGOE01010454.1.p1 GENE.GGOE01010454.1~~GGOE01010454.1.p1  ORF type:complete len:126 (+),score=8.21 GGOE01010454.1:199-576(+)
MQGRSDHNSTLHLTHSLCGSEFCDFFPSTPHTKESTRCTVLTMQLRCLFQRSMLFLSPMASPSISTFLGWPPIGHTLARLTSHRPATRPPKAVGPPPLCSGGLSLFPPSCAALQHRWDPPNLYHL